MFPVDAVDPCSDPVRATPPVPPTPARATPPVPLTI